jgi:NitT/TauT family transport system substrate-binding protein
MRTWARSTLLRALAAPLLAAPAAAQTTNALKLVAPANDSATSALYALHAGWFKRAGLDVELTPMNSGAAVAAAIAGGAANVGLSSLVTIIEAHVRGVPFTLIAPSGYITSDVVFAAFVVRADSALRGPRDLAGKTVASPGLKDLNAVAIMAWIEQGGGDLRSVRFVELPQPASVAAIAEGRVEGAVLGTPTLTSAVESGKVRVLGNAFDAIGKRFQHIAWFTTQSFAERNRSAVEPFSRVMREAALYCNAHPLENAPLVAQFDGVDPKLVERMVRVPFAEYVDGRMIQPLVDAVARYKVIERGFDAAELVSPYAEKPPR